MLICIKQKLSNSETQFMKNLSNTEAGLKKKNVYKKTCTFGKKLYCRFWHNPKYAFNTYRFNCAILA